ncbi:hypothetical protein MHF_0634 [Mycoplasma haemofelis Ohio2]|uniref:Uncharacterized protein n=1 Tax=Mycoplasma haemofelis (strain Ohio2) TaxID=859194 RepID=F6FI58_MYCHI|nr:hypothetical protein MHF_0634 [Mycoplasma haemofelis Ohio2]
MKILSTAALLGLGAIGFGGWYKFNSLKPKTLREYLEWQGLKVDIEEDNTWTAILEENKGIANRAINKESLDISDVKKWCSEQLVKEDYGSVKEYASVLCVDNLKKVRSKIIQKYGKDRIDKLLKQDEDYKVAYVFRKHIVGFLSLIGHQPPTTSEDGEDNDNLEDAKIKFKEWCEGSLEKEVDESLVSNVLSLCTPKKFKTIKELVSQNGEELLTDPQYSSELNAKYEAIKNYDSWKAEKKGTLEEWCKEYEAQPFSDKDVFTKIYPKFRFRCVKTK